MISKLIERLKRSKKHRELFVLSQVKTDVPFQIRAMRDAEGWTQAELGQRTGMPQSVISRMENPDSGFLSIKTLLKLASVFDVALVVRFVSFTELAHWVGGVSYEVKGLSPQALAPPKFDKDLELHKVAPTVVGNAPAAGKSVEANENVTLGLLIASGIVGTAPGFSDRERDQGVGILNRETYFFAEMSRKGTMNQAVLRELEAF